MLPQTSPRLAEQKLQANSRIASTAKKQKRKQQSDPNYFQPDDLDDVHAIYMGSPKNKVKAMQYQKMHRRFKQQEVLLSDRKNAHVHSPIFTENLFKHAEVTPNGRSLVSRGPLYVDAAVLVVLTFSAKVWFK